MAIKLNLKASNFMEYAIPQSVDEALSILNSKPNSAVFAGATDLIPQIRGGRPEPGLIVDLKNIPSLVNLSFSNGTLKIGAATPVAKIKNNAKLTKEFPGLSEASGLIGSDQIQNRASLGGNVCTASPGADTVPSLMVNDALVVIASNKGPPNNTCCRCDYRSWLNITGIRGIYNRVLTRTASFKNVRCL